MSFNYNKKNAKCMWCKRTQNPHPDYSYETIPTQVLISKKGERLNSAIVALKMKKIFQEKMTFFLKKI